VTNEVGQPATSVVSEVARLSRLSGPVVVGQIGLVLMGVVDTLMVGRLPGHAVAQAGMGFTWSFISAVFLIGVGVGMDPLLSQAAGAGDTGQAVRRFWQGLALMVLVSVPVMVQHLVCDAGLTALNQPLEVVPQAAQYAAILSLSVLPFGLFTLLRTWLHAYGRMRPAALAAVVANLINVVANYFLIYGGPGVPALGVAGCAWATVISRWLMLGLLVVAGASTFAPLGWRPTRDWLHIWPVAKITMPVAFQTGFEVWAFQACAIMVGWVSADDLSGHIVASTLASLSFMVPLGIGSAAAARVGNLKGAGRPWLRSAWVAVGMGASVMMISASVFISLPGPLAQLWAPTNQAVIAAAAALIPIAGVFQVFDGVQVVTFGVLRGIGDTRWPSLVNVVGYWVFGIPTGYILTFKYGFGAAGVWWGLVVALAAVSALLMARLAWTTRTVLATSVAAAPKGP
jgi:multidrug resistance protein, MATE family